MKKLLLIPALALLAGCGTVYVPVNEHQVIIDGGALEEPEESDAKEACSRIFQEVQTYEVAPDKEDTYALVTCVAKAPE